MHTAIETQHARSIAPARAKRAPTGAAAASAARCEQARADARRIVGAGVAVVACLPVVAFIEGYSVSIACMVAPFALAALAYVARKVA